MYVWWLVHLVSHDRSRRVCECVRECLRFCEPCCWSGKLVSLGFFGFCRSYLQGCVAYWLVAFMLELCLLSGVKDLLPLQPPLLPFYVYIVRKDAFFCLFFHFYLAAQHPCWFDPNQLSIESISWQLVALPFASQVTARDCISNPSPACEHDGKRLLYKTNSFDKSFS